MADPAHVSCDECRTLNLENGEEPDCIGCGRPKAIGARSLKAWTVWGLLDGHSRQWDTMAGAPIPLRISDIRAECGRLGDPDGCARLVLVIEDAVHAERMKTFKREQEARRQKR